jgi:anti-sigma B factor antagonist
VTVEALGPRGAHVRITGELDVANAAELHEAIEAEITRGRHHLVIDLTAATFLDCTSIASLLRAVAPLRDEPDAAIALAGATGIVKRLLDLLRLERLFDIFPDLDAAVDQVTSTGGNHVDGWRVHPPRSALR